MTGRENRSQKKGRAWKWTLASVLFLFAFAAGSNLSAYPPTEAVSPEQASFTPEKSFTPAAQSSAPQAVIPGSQGPRSSNTTDFFMHNPGISVPTKPGRIEVEFVSDRDADGVPDSVEMFFHTNPRDHASYPNKEEMDRIDGFKPMPYPVTYVQAPRNPLVPGHSNCVGLALWYLKAIAVPASIPDIRFIYDFVRRNGYSRAFDLQQAGSVAAEKFNRALVVWDGQLKDGSRFYHVAVVVHAETVQTPNGREIQVTLLEQPGTGNSVGTSTVSLSRLSNHFPALNAPPSPSIYFRERNPYQR
jgi:hypothetical protein